MTPPVIFPRAKRADGKQQRAERSAGRRLWLKLREEDERRPDHDPSPDAEHSGEHSSGEANGDEKNHGFSSRMRVGKSIAQEMPCERNMKKTAARMHNAAQRKSSRSGCRMYSTTNGTKIVSVMTSCRILSWASEYSDEPIRFAGTMNMYSKNAIPQLRMAAMYHFLSLRFLRCAYQANVMKVFEMTRSPAVRRNVEFIRLVFPSWLPPAPCRQRGLSRRASCKRWG